MNTVYRSINTLAYLFAVACSTAALAGPRGAGEPVRDQISSVVDPWSAVGPSGGRLTGDWPAPSGSGQGGTAGVVGGTDVPLGGFRNEPTVAVNPIDHANIAYASLRSLRVSTDGGVTFEPEVMFTVPVTHAVAGDPSITFDSQGRLFVAYLGVPSPGQGIDVFIAQCDPATGAILVGYPVNVTASIGLPASVEHSHDKDWLAADMNPASPFRDRLYLVWTDFTITGGGNEVLTTYSADQGATWSSALNVSDALVEGFCWPGNNFVAPNGDVYVAYHSQPIEGFDNTANPNGDFGQIFVARSTDGGVTFTQKNLAYGPGDADMTFNVQTTSGAIPGMNAWLQGSVQPWVVADPIRPGRIYVVANDDPDNDTTTAGNDPAQGGDPADVFIVISEDDGLTWSDPARVDGGPAGTIQIMPTANVDMETGCLVVHYYDNRAGAVNANSIFLLDVYMTASTDGGMTFVSDFPINDVPLDPEAGAVNRFAGPPPTKRIGEYNGVAVADCRALSVWTGNTVDGGGDPLAQQSFFEASINACEAAAMATAPSIECPADIELQCDESTAPSGAGEPTVFDACDGTLDVDFDNVIEPGDCDDARITRRTWTVTDPQGLTASCEQEITSVDTRAPQITCPANTSIACNLAPTPAATGEPTADDNCDDTPTTGFEDASVAGACPQERVITRTWSATDNCDNSNSCSQEITVVDDAAPEITCPANASVECGNPTGPSATGSATATDLCDLSPTIGSSDSVDPTGCGNTNTITRTWSATDACGNDSTCTQTITVVDTTPPQITCPLDTTVACNAPTGPGATGTATASDVCDPSLSVTFNDQVIPGNCPQERMINRTWTATDDCNNTSSCLQVITVDDAVNPTINCPSDRTVQCGQSTEPPATGTATGSDNCDTAVTITHGDSLIAEHCGNTVEFTRTWTATDDCGNSNSCSQTITVIDTQDPVINCPDDVVVTCTAANGVPVGDVPLAASATDGCGTVTITDNRPEELYPPSCSSTGGNVVTFTGIDECGNVATCTVTVSVIGDECCPGRVESDTDLTLMPLRLNLMQDSPGPVRTKAKFDIWNSNEIRFSGTERCISCWDQTLLSLYDAPNHFVLANLQTDNGKARIDGEASDVCQGSNNVPMLGIAIKELKYNGNPTPAARTAVPLVGTGEENGRILYDIITPPDEAFDGTGGESVVAQSASVTGAPPLMLDDVATAGTALDFDRATVSAKGSLLIWPKVELKWDAQGRLIQDTFITVVNDNPGGARMQFYFVNGDRDLPPQFNQGQLVERGHPGWNWVDNQISLTGDQSIYWSVATGEPAGTSPFTVLDPGNPPGRPDHDAINPGGRVLRGFVVGWAVNAAGEEIRWNHLTGGATLVNFRDGTAAGYPATAFACVSPALEGEWTDNTPGDLKLNGNEYAHAPDMLILDFIATGSEALSNGEFHP